MIKVLNTKSKKFSNQLSYYLNLRRSNSSSKSGIVKRIINDVRKKKDKSVIKYEKKFSGFKKLNKKNVFFSNSEIKKSIKDVDAQTRTSIDIAYNRILSFHKNQKFKESLRSLWCS